MTFRPHHLLPPQGSWCTLTLDPGCIAYSSNSASVHEFKAPAGRPLPRDADFGDPSCIRAGQVCPRNTRSGTSEQVVLLNLQSNRDPAVRTRPVACATITGPIDNPSLSRQPQFARGLGQLTVF